MIAEDVLKNEERASLSLRTLYRNYGYAQFKMRKFEEYDLYVQNKSFLVSDRVITFTNQNGVLMALKPDVTLSILKNAEIESDSVQKLYYDENVYRVSEQDQNYREIRQVGLECIGAVDEVCLSEVLSLAQQSLAQISPNYRLNVSHMGILSEVLDFVALSPKGRAEVLFCMGQKNAHGICAVCEAEGKTTAQKELLCLFAQTYGTPEQVFHSLFDALPTARSKAMLQQLSALLAPLQQEQVHIDFSVVQDVTYYNGVVFCGYVDGVPVKLLSGGQYDCLMQRMGKRAKAVGFAVYLDLLEAYAESGKTLDADAVLLYDPASDPTVVLQAANQLRAQGLCVNVQTTLSQKRLGSQVYRLDDKGGISLADHA